MKTYKKGDIIRLKCFEDTFYNEMPGVEKEMISFFDKKASILRFSFSNSEVFKIKEDGGNYWYHIDWIDDEVKVNLPDELFKM